MKLLAVLFALLSAACTRGQNACVNPCTNDGDTRCAGTQVQTCLLGSNGCLAWTAAAACGSGEVCEGTACTDLCATAAVVAVCAQTAAHIAACCNVTFGEVKLCHDALAAGANNDAADLEQACAAETQTACADLHTRYQTENLCCCPDGDICDYQSPTWQCAKKCTSEADCTSEAERPSCAPNEGSSEVAFGPLLCKAEDGGAYRGCDAGHPCSAGACFVDAAANRYCSAVCTQDSDCGNTSQACCVLTQSIPAGAGKGCAPCETSGG